MQKLYVIVDTKARMSYDTLVAVASDICALVSDFRTINTNGNGAISRKEFRDYVKKFGFNKQSVLDSAFQYADEDEADEIKFNEYVNISICLLVLRVLFSFQDYDKSGELSKEEVKKALDNAYIPEKIRQKFEQQFGVVDDNNSKVLSYEKFVWLVLLMFQD